MKNSFPVSINNNINNKNRPTLMNTNILESLMNYKIVFETVETCPVQSPD